MASGLLEVSGTIDLAQFWPRGESDADTTKIKITPTAFRFRPHPGAAFAPTNAFENAKVLGKVSKPVPDAQGRLTIRLQGIDAPELHYRPTPDKPPKGKKRPASQINALKQWNRNFRQPLGETATAALLQELSAIGAGPLACVVASAVDHPNDVFDTYGRMVGDILIARGAQNWNMNLWLAEQGWAFPTFYNSMSEAEIDGYLTASEKARKAKAGAWKFYTGSLLPLDWGLVFRKPGPNTVADSTADQGAVIMPKLFRRVTAWAVMNKAKVFVGSFKNYLAARSDECYSRTEFIEQAQAATTRHLADSDFITSGNVFKPEPGDLVFKESPSRLVSPTGTVTHW